MSVPETENNTSSQHATEENQPSSKDQQNQKPDLIESTKTVNFIRGSEPDRLTLQKISVVNHQLNKLEQKMNLETYPTNYRMPQYAEKSLTENNVNPRRDKTRIEELQKCACCVLPKLKAINVPGGLKNSCLTCKRGGCKDVGEGTTCTCQFPKRISFSNCSLNKSTSNNGFVQSTSSQSQTQTPSNCEIRHAVSPRKPDVEKTTLDNDEIINLLLNGLNAVNLAIKLNQPGSNGTENEKRSILNKLGLDAQKIIQDLIELKNSAKLAYVSPPTDLNININSNQIPSCTRHAPESDHSCCFSCNLSSRPVNSQTNMPCTFSNYCQSPPMSSAPDNLCYGNMCDSRLQYMLPKAINCAFQQCQCHPLQWTTVWPVFHSTAFL